MKIMKHFFILLTIMLFIWTCSGPKTLVEAEKDEAPQTAPDSVSYAMETNDDKFKTWYDLHKNLPNKMVVINLESVAIGFLSLYN